MRYGVVVHGPEAIDSGMAAWMLDSLSRDHVVEATLGGAMGLAAVLDAGLEGRIQVASRELVSRSVVRMGRGCDTVILLNWGKTRASGMAFGRMVWDKVHAALDVPLVQVDRDFFVVWEGSIDEDLTNLLLEHGLRENVPTSAGVPQQGVRSLSGVQPGENIWINGTVIGRAVSEKVIVRMSSGRLSFEGVDVKAHGLEKVRVHSLEGAIIRSGSVRRTRSLPRLGKPAWGDRLILVDHRAEDSIFRAEGAKAAVTVGDDTTRVCSALLARLGVPVIGIVDGDEDGICADTASAPGSTMVMLMPGNDDQLGAKVREEIFRGGDDMVYDGRLTDLADRIARMAGPTLLEVRRPS
ncbi:MAG: hypothetical protein A4E31_00614 [Methanomassiliicoccales archaeon PtaU1.Bin030]|nr:MAG: hypothetical protein A4E31_00614 [Methanomassiliicoccales archaeon PtaU1.Bin030]